MLVYVIGYGEIGLVGKLDWWRNWIGGEIRLDGKSGLDGERGYS